jgi:hypothetical protein
MRLLAHRLEGLARVAVFGGAPAREVIYGLEAASAATKHAIRLDLVSIEEAESIWNAARRRHPGAFAASRLLQS